MLWASWSEHRKVDLPAAITEWKINLSRENILCNPDSVFALNVSS